MLFRSQVQDVVKLGENPFSELYCYRISRNRQAVSPGMDLHPDALLDELQVAVVLTEKKLHNGGVFKLNPGEGGLFSLGFQTACSPPVARERLMKFCYGWAHSWKCTGVLSPKEKSPHLSEGNFEFENSGSRLSTPHFPFV